MYPQLIKLQNYSLGLAACYNQTFTEYDMPVHAHDYYEVMFVDSGHCEIKIENNRGLMDTFYLSKNEFIFIDSNRKHKLFVAPGNPSVIFNIEIELKKLDGIGKGLYDFSKIIRACNNIKPLLMKHSYILCRDTNAVRSTLLKVQSAYDLSLRNTKNDINPLLMQLLLGELFIEINQCCDNYSQQDNLYIQKTYEYIKSHYQEDITIATLSEYLNIHPTYIHKLFKQYTNDSVHNVINKYRVQKSIDLLSNTALPLVDIAIDVGFNNRQSYFNAFKKFTGKSPTDYRNAYINNEKWILAQAYKTSVFDE